MARPRLRWGVKLVPAVACLVLAVALPSDHSRVMGRAALGLFVVGVALAVAALLSPDPGEARAPLRRRQFALGLASSALSFALLVAVAARLRPGPTEAYRRSMLPEGSTMQPSQGEAELGWAPSAPVGVVGQRLERADFGRARVLVMGDSILYGYGVTHEQTAPRLIEPMLGGPQVLNASVSGYSIDQYYLYLRRILPVIKPRLLVVGVFSGNDWQLTGRSFVWGNKKPLLRVEGERLVPSDDGAACADDLSKSLLLRALWQRPAVAERLIGAVCAPRELAPREHEALMTRLFDEIDREAASVSAQVLWVMLPPRHTFNVYDEIRYFYVEKHRELRRTLLAKPGRDVVDLAGDVQQTFEVADELFQEDQAHFTAAGHVVLARWLARDIADRGRRDALW